MNPVAIAFLLAASVAIMTVPRRWAPMPLVVGCCYMTNAQQIAVGPFNFTILRILLLLGFIRITIRNEQRSGGLKGMDMLILAWGICMICSSVVHKNFGNALVFRLGSAYNVVGTYFLFRAFCQDEEDVIQLLKITAFALVPLAVEMAGEKVIHKNFFSFLGGVPLEVVEREGKIRAQGPFGHPIISGTVGGLCIPLMIALWTRHQPLAKIGLAACLLMVWASASSGPLMTALVSFVGLLIWRWRHLTQKMRIAAVCLYLACNVLMTRPAYFLLEKIDLTGSSTGYHRAMIIDSGIRYMGDWWLGGTDYTRQWVAYGTSWNEDMVDITNHYLFYAVDGGISVMLILVAELWLGFRYVRQCLELQPHAPFSRRFLMWCLGSSLFSSAATMVSVAYFDQSSLLLYMNLAIIASMHGKMVEAAQEETLDYSNA